MKNKKGFTLIELLAVIVILGVVMAIAIPSMNKVIDDSKKDTLISSAKEYISGAKNFLTSEGVLPDYGAGLIVSVEKIAVDRGGKSPFTSGQFVNTQSYIVVTNTADINTAGGVGQYNYYIALMDESRNCLIPTSEENLNNKAKVTRTFIKSGSQCNISGITPAGGQYTSLNGLPGNITYSVYQ